MYAKSRPRRATQTFSYFGFRFPVTFISGTFSIELGCTNYYDYYYYYIAVCMFRVLCFVFYVSSQGLSYQRCASQASIG